MAAATWCSDPAMILLDLLTTKRYGFGTHSSNQANDRIVRKFRFI